MKIQQLCKSFDGRVVLDHVSLTLESGGTACLMAPSGRGKTTLLRCIAGLERPDSGQITDLPERIGYVFQEDRLCDGFSAVDNIRLVTGRAMDEGEICRHLKELGLADSLGQPVRELSGGSAAGTLRFSLPDGSASAKLFFLRMDYGPLCCKAVGE